MSEYPPCPNSENQHGSATQAGRCRTDSGILSERLLDAMQTGLVFFNAQGTICRMNVQARKELSETESPSECKISELLSIIHHNDDILPELLSRLDRDETGRIDLPRGAFIRRGDRKTQFFISGNISRLECGCRVFSFRNMTDELTNERILGMALTRTKIFPWFYDMERDKMLIDTDWFVYLGLPVGDGTMSNEEFFARVHPDEREMLAEALRQQLSDQEIDDSFSYRLLRADGSWEWFSEQSVYLGQTDDGLPARIVGVCQSIQEHKTIEDTLRAARDKARESDRLKSAFLANMSHELRTPLNAIVGFSNLLAGGDVDPGSEEAGEYAALIGKNCDDLLALVSDIFDLSQIETGAMEYDFAEHSLGQLLSETHRKFKDKIPPGTAFNLLLPTTDTRIETDILHLRQVVEHLLGNAVKFTDKGHIDMGYALSDDGKGVRVFVEDSGRGIPPDRLEKIFERFYKVDSFTQGAGLGLSICRTIIERMGGSLVVSSRLKEGSRFTACLPLRQ